MTDMATRSLVAFTIETEEFALEIGSVQEINRCVEVTRIPNSSRHVQGVMNLRGKIIPVINLRSMLGFSEKTADEQSRIVVTEFSGVVAGFLVDSVSEVVQVPENEIHDPPAFGQVVEPHYVSGLAKMEDRLLILLNLQALFRDHGAAEGGALSNDIQDELLRMG